MNDNFPGNTPLTGFLVSCGAGVAAAALFALAMRNAPTSANLSPVTAVWSFLAPAPLMVAGMAFSATVGWGAAFVGVAFLAVAFSSAAAFSFLISIALPSLTLCLVVLRAPLPGPISTAIIQPKPWRLDRSANYAVIGAVLGASLLVASSLTLDVQRLGSYEAVLDQSSEAIKILLKDFWSDAKLPETISIDQFARFMAVVMPTGAAALFTLTFVCNMWFAGHVARRSHRLMRPWPDLALDLRLSPTAAGAFVLCLATVFVGSGFVSALAGIGAGALGAAFSLQGYAVVHVLTRGLAARPALLAVLYLITLLAPPWAMTFMLIGGWLESFVNMRSQTQG